MRVASVTSIISLIVVVCKFKFRCYDAYASFDQHVVTYGEPRLSTSTALALVLP